MVLKRIEGCRRRIVILYKECIFGCKRVMHDFLDQRRLKLVVVGILGGGYLICDLVFLDI